MCTLQLFNRHLHHFSSHHAHLLEGIVKRLVSLPFINIRNQSTDSKTNMICQQKFDYLLALDFEATCKEDTKPQNFYANDDSKPAQEIIEFPVLKINCETFEIESTFHSYVRPTINPQLSDFCTRLTGIIQDTVDQAEPLESVLQKFDKWMADEKLITYDANQEVIELAQFTFITCGNWDLGVMLPNECDMKGLKMPSYMKRWINLKKSYSNCFGKWPQSLMSMCEDLGITPDGRWHSGIDDCKTLAQIAKKIALNGHVFSNTTLLTTTAPPNAPWIPMTRHLPRSH